MTSREDYWYPKGTLAEPFLPQEIDKATMAFPANVEHLLPPADSIPDDFIEDSYDNKWHKLFNAMFFGPINNLSFERKEGIDAEKAYRHIRAIMGSFQPKHQYKEHACAYLMSLWFEDATWETG